MGKDEQRTATDTTGAELRPCPLCGAAPELIRRFEPLINWGRQFEPPAAQFSVKCPCCGLHTSGPRAEYCYMTHHLITDDEARQASVNRWNLRSAAAPTIDTDTGLLSCPFCGATATNKYQSQGVSMRTRVHSTGALRGCVLRCNFGLCCGLDEDLPPDATEDEIAAAFDRLRERWNQRTEKRPVYSE